ncbi:cysteine-rich receptor-like protein kinase 10, partial [Tanacetum coccineum]
QDMNAKNSDFGLTRIFGVDQTQASTNRIVGTYGYMSPEYAVRGQFSMKSDVFAFGVVAWTKWTEGTTMELIDPTMVETSSKDEVMRRINIGLLCVQEDVDARPSMSSVLNMLNNYSLTLPSPKRPPFYLFQRSASSRLLTQKMNR